MGRHGVSYIDITQAAVSLKKQGLEPTVDRVREYLGTGSKSTIAPLLKKWKEKTQENTDDDEQPLPTDLLSSIHDLYESIEKRAREKIILLEQTHAEEKQELTLELQKKTTEVTETQEKLIAEHISLEEQQRLCEQLQTDKKENIEKIRQIEQEKMCLQEKLSAIENNHSRLLEDQKSLRKHFDHYQQRIAEEHQKAKNSWLLSAQDMQETINRYREDQMTTRETIEKLKGDIRIHENQYAAQENAHAILRTALNAEKARCQMLEKEKEDYMQAQKTAQKQYADLQSAFQTLEKNYELIQNKQQLLEKNNQFLYQMVEEEKKSSQELRKQMIQLLQKQQSAMEKPQHDNTNSH